MARQFDNPAAFRASVDQRLRNYASQVGVPVFIVRRQAALERLMARLMHAAPNSWALKGGFALDTRLGRRARASLDVDLDHAHGADLAREDLAHALRVDLGDLFSFAIVRTRAFTEAGESLAERHTIECSVSGGPFETLQVDVTLRPPEVWEVERKQRPGLLAELGLGPIEIAVVPIERQIAEKLHAYTRIYGKEKATTRARDFVDLVIIRASERPDAMPLRQAIHRTFATRKTHDVPEDVPPLPTSLATAYRTEAATVGITTDIKEAHQLVASWLNPVLAGQARGRWDPEHGYWA